MKRAVSFILLTVFLLLLQSCGAEKNRSYDEGEVKSAAQSLIAKSENLNKIIWGNGIPYVEDDNYRNGQYYPADPIYLSKHGISTLNDLISDVREVFSKSYSQSIIGSAFSSSVGEYGMAGYTRYYQGEEVIMVYAKYNPLLVDTVEYYYDRITVVGSKGDIVTVKVPIKVTRGDLTQEREIEVDLIEEENGWRIDSPTYAGYRAQ